MKITLSTLLLILSLTAFNCLSQLPDVAVSNIQHLGLFRGYDNKIGFYCEKPNTEFYVVSDNAQVSKDTLSGFYIVRAGSNHTATFYFIDINTLDTITEKTLPVKNIPRPSLYLGALENGSQVKKDVVKVQKKLFSKYPPGVPINATFSVKSYTFVFGETKNIISGTGSNLNEECLQALNSVIAGERLDITAIVLGPDGLNRKITSTIYIQ